MTTLIKRTFDFGESTIRILGDYDNPLFIAKDICGILGLSNVSVALRAIPQKWKGLKSDIETLSGFQDMLTLTESGLYKLIMRSNKPQAEKFQEWVCEEVLPAIRKEGEFKFRQAVEEASNQKIEKVEENMAAKEKEIKDLNRLLKRKLRRSYSNGNSVYVVKSPDIEGKFKVGCTKNLDRRLRDYRDSSPHDYEALFHRCIVPMRGVEELLLFVLDKYRIQSDFKGSRKREWLEVDSKIIIEEFNAICDYATQLRKKHDPDYDGKECQEDNDEDCSSDEELKPYTCFSCKEEKTPEDFYGRIENRDGKENLCKQCYVKRQLKAREAKRVKLLGDKKKRCRRCKTINHLSKYKPNSLSKDGHSYICDKCTKKPVLFRTEKTCSKCKVLKSTDNFNNCRTSSDGKFAYCKECSRKRNKAYKAKIRGKDI